VILNTLLLSLALFSSSVSGHTAKGEQLFVRANRTIPVERLAAAVASIGKVESREPGTSTYLIQLNPGVDDEVARERLAKVRGVIALEGKEEEAEFRSALLRGEHLAKKPLEEESENSNETAEAEKAEAAGPGGPSERTGFKHSKGLETGGPGEAMRWRRLALVDEHGKIPPDAMTRAIAQKKKLASTHHSFLQGDNWVPQGPNDFSGRSCCLVIDPNNPLTIWEGSAGGGIWKSLDGGTSWTAVGDGLPSLAVNTLVLDPNDQKTLYAGTGEGYFNYDAIGGGGVYKSTDGGITWTQLPGTVAWGWSHINRIAVAPGDSNLILVCQQYGGIFRSTDGGNTFSNPMWAQSGHAIAFCPTNTNRVIGTIQDYDYTNNVWYAATVVSNDAGITWTKSTGPLNELVGFSRIETCPVVTDQNTVYASASDGNIYKSIDGGQSYVEVTTSGNSGADWYGNAIWVDPTNPNRIVVGGVSVYESTDGGQTLNQVGAGYIQTDEPHPDIHYFLASPGYDGVTNKVLYVCTDGGLYEASDITTANVDSGWLRRDQGATTSQYYSVAGDGPSGLVIGGLQDNGTQANAIGNPQANYIFGGDGGFVAIDPTNAQTMYGEYVDLELFRQNGGVNGYAQWIYSGIADAGNNANFISPFILDPNQSQTLLAGGASLWRSTNAGASPPSWSAIRGPGTSLISAIAVAKGNSDIIWVGQNDGFVVMTTNGTSANPTWTTISDTTSSAPLPARYVTRILIDPNQSNVVYITFGGFSSDNIWKSTNSGATWSPITGTGSAVLPQVPIRAIARRPGAPNVLYVGTEIGIFSTDDGGQTWTTSSDMPANVCVDELAYMNNSNTLLAGTHGRGIWSLAYVTGAIQSVSLNPGTVEGGNPSTGTVTLAAAAPATGLLVTLSSSSTNAIVPETVFVPSGATSATFTVSTTSVTTTMSASISATRDTSTASGTLTISAPGTVSSVSLSPASVTGGSSTTGTVALSLPAPAGGIIVNLSSSSSNATVPATVTIAGGSSTATFTVNTIAVQSTKTATISATLGATSKSSVLTINPPALQAIALSPSAVTGGTKSTGAVTLSGPAAVGGVGVSLSSNLANATVQASVTVLAGATTATFTVSTTGVASISTATITAVHGSVSLPATLTINPPSLVSLTANPTTLTGGNSSTGTVTLSGIAPTGGLVINLTSTSATVTPPASVTVAGGASTATFAIKTSGVSATSTATVTATLGTVNQSVTLTINPAVLSGITLSPSAVIGGFSSTGTVALTGAAPSGGIAVSLTSSYSRASVPASVVIPAGASSATFPINTTAVQSNSTATITATSGALSKTAILTINAPTVLSVTVSPSSVVGGTKSTGMVTLSGPAAVGGVGISLSSSSTTATVQSSVTVLAGATSATFTISTTVVSNSVPVTITASHGASSQSATLTVIPAGLASVSVSPSSVIGGASSTGTVTLNGAAGPGGTSVSLSSNSANAVPPASVFVPAGATSATFTITTTGVSATTSATITGTLGAVSHQATLTINPASLTGVALSPSSVIGGATSTGTVTLSGPAPTGGTVVSLASSNTAYATVLTSVTVAAGSTTGTFTVSSIAVQSTKTVTITGTLSGTSKSAVLTVNPPALVSITLSPSSVTGGGKSTGTITLSGPAAVGGVGITLSSNSTDATVQSSVTVPAGATSVNFTVNTTAVTNNVTATITATHGTVSLPATLNILVS